MNPLEKLHKEIDKGALFQKKRDTAINEWFKKVGQELHESGQTEVHQKAEAERQVFAFSKSPAEGLEPMMSGEKDLEDGSTAPFEWPDINNWEETDFSYIKSRFRECQDLYAKAQYGLFLFYAGYLVHNQNVEELLRTLRNLADKYLDVHRSQEQEDDDHSLFYFRDTMGHALYIASKRSGEEGIKDIFQELIEHVFDLHQKLDPGRKEEARAVWDLTDFAWQYFKPFQQVVDLEQMLKKNKEVTDRLSQDDKWGAVDLARSSQRLSEKVGGDPKYWLRFIASQYEELAEEAFNTARHLVGVDLIEKALRIYRDLQDEDKVRELEKKYQDQRGKTELEEFREDFSKEESQKIHDMIEREVQDGDKKEILENFAVCPMFPKVEMVLKEVEESEGGFFMRFAEKSVLDKFGNIVEKYPPGSEYHQFIENYSYHFQVGTQILLIYFHRAFEENKLSFDTILSFLEASWLNESIIRHYDRFENKVVPFELLKPCLRSFFREFEQWKENGSYQPDLVSVTDSLVLKAEAMLRYLCDRLGIATFKQKKGDVVMERNLEELLGALEHKPEQDPPHETNFSENDRQFMKFVLTEKAGLNLRNKVAHGLMDANEYTLEKPVLAFTILMRLSKYKFKKKEGS